MDIPPQEITHRINGAAMRVHNQLGPSLREIHYQKALSAALSDAGLSYEEEMPFHVTMDGEWLGMVFLDRFVEGSVVADDKALGHLLTNDEKRLEYKRTLKPGRIVDWRSRMQRYVWRPRDQGGGHVSDDNPLSRFSSVVGEYP